jgi:hypothetical protein
LSVRIKHKCFKNCPEINILPLVRGFSFRKEEGQNRKEDEKIREEEERNRRRLKRRREEKKMRTR